MIDELLRPKDVAQLTSTPTSTLETWRRQPGKGPQWFRLGRNVVYRRSAVEAWLLEQERLYLQERVVIGRSVSGRRTA